MTDDQYAELLAEIEHMYPSIPIYEKGWGYAVAATRLRPGNGLIAGLNWGGDEKSFSCESMQSPPTINSFDEVPSSDLGSMKRLIPFLQEYRAGIKYGQANICAYRSPRQHDLPYIVLKDSMAIFLRLLSFAQPCEVLITTTLGWDTLRNTGLLKYSQQKTERVALISVGKSVVLAYHLPHPNARLSAQKRKLAWDECFRC